MHLRSLVVSLVWSGLLFGQSFEAASIKPSKQGDGNSSWGWNGVRFNATSITGKRLIAWAYDVREFQIAGPNWLEGEGYDIVAAGAGDVKLNDAQMRQMVKSLLAERFGLKLHKETREMPAYKIHAVPGGAKLQATKSPQGGNFNMRRGQMEFSGVGLGALAQALAGLLGRPVVNDTGLTDRYDGTLTFAPDGTTDGPSIFTALTEQFGLRLDSERASVEMLSVDDVTRPTPN